MGTTTKALALARELTDTLTKKVAATLPVVVSSFDTNSNPVTTLSSDTSPATGKKVVVIRIAPVSVLATDIMGNSANVFTPHTIDICTEMNYAGTNDNIADILTPVELLPVLAEIAKKGCMVRWYQTANGTVPSTSAMISSNLIASDSNLYWSASISS